uniref:Lysosomal-associated transmembrane protein 4A n=1 Tax=Lygus hesperus TaxID=30085 RepID=A0A0A9YN87_LYGHE
MQGLSAFKIGEREDWRCGICCHVRTATIFLGVWHLMLHILTLSIIAVVLKHPELMNTQLTQHPGSPFSIAGTDNTKLPVVPSPSSAESQPELNSINIHGGHSFPPNRHYDYQHLNVSVVVMFSTFAITMLMVYGAIKGKPSYLMPFFCLQLFDFCIASITALSSLCYLPDMRRLIAESPKIPMQAYLLTLSPQLLAFVVLITFTSAMVVKAYFIGVVWSCYRYLTFRLIAASRTVHFIPESPPPDLQDLLPDYETACAKFPQSQATQAPPSYSQAVAAAPPNPPVTVPTPAPTPRN